MHCITTVCCLFKKVVITFFLQELLRSLCIRSNVAIKQMTLAATVRWCPINLKGEQLWCDTNTNAQRHVWWMRDGKGGLLLVKGERTTSLSAELWQEPYITNTCHGKVCHVFQNIYASKDGIWMQNTAVSDTSHVIKILWQQKHDGDVTNCSLNYGSDCRTEIVKM